MTPTDDFAVFYDSVFARLVGQRLPLRPRQRPLAAPPGPGRAPLRLGELRYDEQGRLRFPSSHAQAEDALAGYLQEARRLLATRPDPPEADGGSLPGLSADFETLRWFVLPRECLPG